jgi:hypothetical protein
MSYIRQKVSTNGVKIMKRAFFRNILLLCILLVSSSFNSNPIDPCGAVNNSFQEGEHVVYKIYYNWNFVWLSAGEVDFKLSETDEHYIVEATGKTYKSYEVFFRVNDYYKTVIDKETMLPVEFERNIEEGGYRFYNKLEFDQEMGEVISYSGRTKEDVTAKIHPIESCMHDMLSTVYFLRNLNFIDFESVQKFPVKMFIDDEIYPIEISYEGKEKKSIKGFGDIDAIKISPQVVAGVVFTNEAKMDIWVSDDNNKVPLVIESPISVGSIQAILKSHTGLKHSLGD